MTAFGCPAHVYTDPPEASSTDGGDDNGGDGGDNGDNGDNGGSPTPTSGASTTGPSASTTGSSDETGTSTGTGETGEMDATTVSTTAPFGECGDGRLDRGESCDFSYAENKDDGACTKDCQNAYCGDGLVWAGQEQCDHGTANNDTLYGGCRGDCTFGPSCNDGIVQPEEECDASAPEVEGSVKCDAGTCRMMARVAFVTSAQFSGDIGGLTGADATCVGAATAAGLDNAGNFLAYMGDGAAAPVTRFIDGAKAKGFPYARRDGQKLANDLDDLFWNGPRIPLVITELGTALPPEQLVWTGVGLHGEADGEHCEAWGTTYFKYKGRVGRISPATDSDADLFNWQIDGDWVKYTFRPCFTKAVHLYCVED